MNAMKADQKQYDILDQEEAAILVFGLKHRVTITLEGADIVTGRHDKHGMVTIVTPAAGQSCLLYPFET